MAARGQHEVTDEASARQFLADVVEAPEDKIFNDILTALTVLYQAGQLK